MNPRLPYSARSLINEIKEIDEDAKVEADDLDGLGTYRSIFIECGDPLGIGEAISRVQQIDRRISVVSVTDKGIAVGFPPDRIVESHARFGLGDIYNALLQTSEDYQIESEAQSTERPVEDVALPDPPAKKATPRKRAAKKKSDN